MSGQTFVIRGRYADHTFIPDGPLPDAEGVAELVITPTAPRPRPAIVDAIGKVEPGRTGEDIAEQIRDERSGWDGR